MGGLTHHVSAITIHAGHHSHMTRLTTMCASRNAVFGTTELLLKILRHLDPHSLLKVRRVNKYYNALILTDQVTQRILFLAPLATGDKVQWIMDRETRVIKRYQPGEEHARGPEWTKRQGAVKLAELNPVVFKREPGNIHSLDHRFALCETLLFTRRPDFYKSREQDRLVFHMYLSQPPPKRVEVYFSYWHDKPYRSGQQEKPEATRLTVENRDGVTVGDLAREFMAALKAKRISQLSMPLGPLEDACLKLPKCYVWMKGVIFSDKEEIKAVEAGDNPPGLPGRVGYVPAYRPDAQQTSAAGDSPKAKDGFAKKPSARAKALEMFVRAAQAGESVAEVLERTAAERMSMSRAWRIARASRAENLGYGSFAETLRGMGMDV